MHYNHMGLRALSQNSADESPLVRIGMQRLGQEQLECC